MFVFFFRFIDSRIQCLIKYNIKKGSDDDDNDSDDQNYQEAIFISYS